MYIYIYIYIYPSSTFWSTNWITHHCFAFSTEQKNPKFYFQKEAKFSFRSPCEHCKIIQPIFISACAHYHRHGYRKWSSASHILLSFHGLRPHGTHHRYGQAIRCARCEGNCCYLLGHMFVRIYMNHVKNICQCRIG